MRKISLKILILNWFQLSWIAKNRVLQVTLFFLCMLPKHLSSLLFLTLRAGGNISFCLQAKDKIKSKSLNR